MPTASTRPLALPHGLAFADLYTGDEDQALLRITQGRLDVRSLAVPGYGVAFEPDLDAMIPLENWTPASLEDTA